MCTTCALVRYHDSRNITLTNEMTFSFRSSHPVVFYKKGILKNFSKFTRKHQEETLAQIFSCEFCEILKNTLLYRTPSAAASVHWISFTLNTFRRLKITEQQTYIGLKGEILHPSPKRLYERNKMRNLLNLRQIYSLRFNLKTNLVKSKEPSPNFATNIKQF